jgi:hypothetical protein
MTAMKTKYVEEERNFGIRTIHTTLFPIHVKDDVPFKGTLSQVKEEAQKILDRQEGDNWKVVAYNDGRTIYCTYRKTEPAPVVGN